MRAESAPARLDSSPLVHDQHTIMRDELTNRSCAALQEKLNIHDNVAAARSEGA
jgi:hypothetical protein